MSIILAKIFGLYFLGVGLAGLFNPKHISRLYKKMMESEAHLYLAGIIALLVGAFLISVHNIWIADWRIILTLIGWISFIKGLGLVGCKGFPDSFSCFFDKTNSFYQIVGAILLFIGLFLCYKGFVLA